MSNCKKCGAEIPPESKFCSNCGTEISIPEKKEEKSAGTQPAESAKPKRRGCLKGCLTIILITLFLILLIIGLLAYYFYKDDPDGLRGILSMPFPQKTETPRELPDVDIPGIVSLEEGEQGSIPEKHVDSGDLNKAAAMIEEAFSKGDTLLLKQLLTPASRQIYKEVFREIAPYMSDYGKVFKTRKLIMSTPIYALYEFRNDAGKKFTAEFSPGDDGNWRLVRF